MVCRWYSRAAGLLAVMLAATWSFEVHAQQTRTAEVPVQIGVGPAGYLLGGPTLDEVGWGGGLFDEQPIHTGLRLSLMGVIDAELVDEHPGMVPSQHRGRIQQAGEVRYAPGIVSLIPSSLYLSPGLGDASVWGATWSPIAIGMALTSEPVRFSGRGAVIATAKYISSETVSSPYVFLRPGVELNFDLEIPIAEEFLVSFGWSSKVHLPQPLDGGILDVGDFDEDSLWHIGQFYMQVHFRVPYSHQYRVQ